MAENKGVSVIIPCYNDGRFLQEAVESVYAQNTPLNFEVIIVDDCSTEQATIDKIALLEAEFQNLYSVRHENNQGVAEARNTGLSYARYPYIFILDADNKLSTDPKFLKKGGYMDRAIKVLENDPDVVFVRCEGELFEAKTGYWPVPPISERGLLSNNRFDTHSMYRREEAIAVGGYRKTPALRACDDWDFAVAMFNSRIKQNLPAKGHTIIDPLFLYRIRKDETSLTNQHQRLNVSHKPALQDIIKRSPEIYKKHFPNVPLEELPEYIMQTEYTAVKNIKTALSRLYNPRAFGYLIEKSLNFFGKRLSSTFNHLTNQEKGPIVKARPSKEYHVE